MDFARTSRGTKFASLNGRPVLLLTVHDWTRHQPSDREGDLVSISGRVVRIGERVTQLDDRWFSAWHGANRYLHEYIEIPSSFLDRCSYCLENLHSYCLDEGIRVGMDFGCPGCGKGHTIERAIFDGVRTHFAFTLARK